MIRTQIYLTEAEHQGIGRLAKSLKRPQSEVIRQAIDEFLVRINPDDKLAQIRKARGIWKNRQIPDLSKLRSDFDRY